MPQPVFLKRSAIAGKTPTTADLALGELAINTSDGKLFFKKNSAGTESIVTLGASSDTPGSQTADQLRLQAPSLRALTGTVSLQWRDGSLTFSDNQSLEPGEVVLATNAGGARTSFKIIAGSGKVYLSNRIVGSGDGSAVFTDLAACKPNLTAQGVALGGTGTALSFDAALGLLTVGGGLARTPLGLHPGVLAQSDSTISPALGAIGKGTGVPRVYLARQRGTAEAPEAVQDQDSIGLIHWYGLIPADYGPAYSNFLTIQVNAGLQAGKYQSQIYVKALDGQQNAFMPLRVGDGFVTLTTGNRSGGDPAWFSVEGQVSGTARNLFWLSHANSYIATHKLSVFNYTPDAPTQLMVGHMGDNSAPYFSLYRGRGSQDSGQFPKNGDRLGQIDIGGYMGDRGFPLPSVYFTAEASGDWSATNRSAELLIATTVGTAWTERLRFRTDGVLVASNIMQSSAFISTVATGTPPLTVASRTTVANLNADMVDGYHVDTVNNPGTIPVRDGEYGLIASAQTLEHNGATAWLKGPVNAEGERWTAQATLEPGAFEFQAFAEGGGGTWLKVSGNPGAPNTANFELNVRALSFTVEARTETAERWTAWCSSPAGSFDFVTFTDDTEKVWLKVSGTPGAPDTASFDVDVRAHSFTVDAKEPIYGSRGCTLRNNDGVLVLDDAADIPVGTTVVANYGSITTPFRILSKISATEYQTDSISRSSTTQRYINYYYTPAVLKATGVDPYGNNHTTFDYDATIGRLNIGSGATRVPFTGYLGLTVSSARITPIVGILSHTDSPGGQFYIARHRGTPAAPAVLNNGDRIGSLDFLAMANQAGKAAYTSLFRLSVDASVYNGLVATAAYIIGVDGGQRSWQVMGFVNGNVAINTGMDFFGGSCDFAVTTGSPGDNPYTERLRLKGASGFLGVGTSTPQGNLHVQNIAGTIPGLTTTANQALNPDGTAVIVSAIGKGSARFAAFGVGASAGLDLHYTQSTTPGYFGVGVDIGTIRWRGWDANTTDWVNAFTLTAISEGTWTSTSRPTALSFASSTGTAMAERMRIRADGAIALAGNTVKVFNPRGHLVLRPYAKAALPTATDLWEMICVTDDAGGAVPAFWDGAAWRRVTDRAAIS